MAYTEQKSIASINVTSVNSIEVLEVTSILKDGVEVTQTNKRFAFMPGEDISAMDDRVKAIAALVWTPEVIAAWNERKAQSAQAYAGLPTA